MSRRLFKIMSFVVVASFSSVGLSADEVAQNKPSALSDSITPTSVIPASASTSTSTSISTISTGVPSVGGTLLHVLLVLLFVVGLILCSAWAAKKLRFSQNRKGAMLSATAVLPLGVKEKAVLVNANGKQMLLGVASGNVSLLHVFDDNASLTTPLDEVLRSDMAEPTVEGDIADNLKSDVEVSAEEVKVKNSEVGIEASAVLNQEHYGFTHFLRLALAEKISSHQQDTASNQEGKP